MAAPAGAGKTTLVASYIESRRIACLWYQVDSGDRDLASFFHYLGLAVARAAPRFRRPLPKLTPEYLGGIAVFARNFFREVGRRMRPSFALVLDNLQEVDAAAQLHAVLCEGLSELPPGGHVILVSRTAAPEAYARLRVNRQLDGLDWEELRLSENESRGLVRALGRGAAPAPSESIDSLHRRCEGWIAGLILLRELAPGRDARPEQIRTAPAQALFDYFATEVFARRAPAVRDFLLLTALFPSFTAAMAERLTGYARTDVLLGDLVRQHHFTERRSESPESFQYHSLFREFLIAQALATWGAAEIARQRQRAAAILERGGRVDEALPLYLAAGDSSAAARLIRVRAENLAATGRHATLAALIERLPAANLEHDPWLMYWHALTRLSPAPAEARADLEAAYDRFDATDDSAGLYLAWTAIVESFFIEYRDYLPVDRWIPVFESLRARHPEFPSPQLEARVLYAAVGMLQQRFIDHPLLPGLAERLEVLIEATPDANRRALLGIHCLLYHMVLGRTERAKQVLAMMRIADERPGIEPVIRLTSCLCVALLEWYLGHPRTALRYVEQGLELVNEHELPAALKLFILNQGIYGSLARGDARGASRFLEQMRVLVAGRNDIPAAIYHHCATMTAAHHGDLTVASEHGATSTSLAERRGVLFGYFCNLYSFANVALLRGDREKGSAMLADARAIGAKTGSRYIELLCGLSECAFFLEDAEREAAIAKLRRVLTMSRELGGPAVPFLPHRVLARVYGAALEHGVETEHVKDLIAKLEVAPTDEVLHVDAWPWPVKIYTLGRFGVAVNGATLKFAAKAQKKPLDLLKALIAFGGRNVREDRLVGVLWPDADTDRAALALTTTVHRLRRLVGQKAVERLDGRITLDARVCWVDAWSLERVLAAAERTCHTGSPEAIDALAENLPVLYRGAFLSDHDEEPWLLATRERIRDKLLRVLGSAADALVRVQRHEQAVRCLQKSLEIEPLAEGTYRRLMETHLARQQRSEALAAYRRCRKVLAAHFGVEPSPDTEAIRRRIRPA